jgi:hypothetical protein
VPLRRATRLPSAFQLSIRLARSKGANGIPETQESAFFRPAALAFVWAVACAFARQTFPIASCLTLRVACDKHVVHGLYGQSHDGLLSAKWFL